MKKFLFAIIVTLIWWTPAHSQLQILKGTTCSNSAPRSCLVHLFIQDSSSTVGAGLTGLTNSSANLVCYYLRSDQGNAGATQLSLVAGTLGTWSSGGFKEKDATNAPGEYELGIATAMVATGANSVRLHCKGATNMAPVVRDFPLTDYDPQNSTNLGLSLMPANATQINGISTSSVTTVNANQGTTQPVNFTGTGASALVKSDVTDIATVAVSTSTAQIGVNVVNISGSVSTGAAGSVGIDWAQVANKTSTVALTNTTVGTTTAVTNGVTVSTNNDKTGYSLTQAFPTNFSLLNIDSNGRARTQAPFNKNIANSTGHLFLMTDSTNHAPKTGLTVTCQRSLDSAAFANGTLGAVTELSSGWYILGSYGAGDLNGNEAVLRCTATGADDQGWSLEIWP